MESHNRSVAQALSVYRLRARPQVEAPGTRASQVHRQPGRRSRVVISADGLEDVDWDVASPPQAWILILPELIYCSGEKWGYQVGMEWSGEGELVVVPGLPGQGPAGRLEVRRRRAPSRSRLARKERRCTAGSPAPSRRARSACATRWS